MDANHLLRILIVEDVPSDAELAERELRNSGFQYTSVRVDTKEAFLKALEDFQPHLIISDYAMPEFDGMQALMLSLEYDAKLPFIVLTGSMNEETAVACMKAGATDYVIKDHLARLPFAVREALEKKKVFLEKEEAERSLQESEERYRNLFENANESIFVVQDGKMVFFNPMTSLQTGYSDEELMARPFLEFVYPDDRDMVIDRHVRRMKGEEIPHTYSFRIIHGDGNIKWVEASAKVIIWHGKAAALIFISDITDRKQVEEALRESEQRFMDVLYSSSDAVLLIDGEHFVDCNEATARMLGYASRHEFLQPHPSELSPPTQPDGRNSFEKANEMMKIASERGFHQFEWVHRRSNGEDFPVEVSLTSILLHGKNVIYCMWRDLTERKRNEKRLNETLESLRNAVKATIQVMVSAVEVRDPYTAGHQNRVADLARVIATEMGLSQEKIEAISMAGPIHDIGKLSIPAEILSKPTKLTNIEFALVKEHSRIGYEILKDVESPWPLAEIVYQHHERMDGSGYPRNLKGDDIIMEARIMAVADVVESMASHRPYRPALGIDAALKEIDNNQGTTFDAAVVAACLSLFREKGFQLEGA